MMTRTVGVLASLTLCSSTLTTSAQVAPAHLLSIDETLVADRHVHVTVRNTAQQDIHAWGLIGWVTYEDGTVEKTGIYMDGMLRGFRDNPIAPVRSFTPKSSLTKRIPSALRPVPVKAVQLTVSVIVLADGTATGDERMVASIFEDRQRQLAGLRHVEKLFSESIARGAGSWDALTAIQNKLAETSDPLLRETAAFHEALQNVTLWIRLRPRDLDTPMQHLLKRTRAHITIAERHLQRR
jgi:hypothetical protein